MKLLCLGDIALADNRLSDWVWSPPNGLIPSNETRFLFNWELPIGDRVNPIPRISGPRIIGDRDAAQVIRSWSPGFAALATNHILDAGEEGLADTITTLHQAGFQTFGAGQSDDEIIKPLLWETNEGRLAVVNWVFPETHPDWEVVPGPNCWPGIEEAREIIMDLKHQADWVMVQAHWSDELFPYPRPEDRVIARELADAGTDILVSHHPHVVRGMEIIGTCPVFYSLGNFYFSDFADSSGGWIAKWAPRNREGLGILITFKHGLKPEYKVLSFWQANGRVIKDPLRRAARRMAQTSQPLDRFKDIEYDQWYVSERSRFDRYWARWHFGVRRLGVWGLVRNKLSVFNSHARQGKTFYK